MQHAPTIDSPVPADAPTARRRRRGILAVLLGLTTVSLGAGLFSLAYFTDTDSLNSTFASGSIDIQANPVVDFTIAAMMPGDTKTASFDIDNDGTAELRYALTADASGTLGTALTLEVREEGTSCAVFDGASVLAPTSLDTAAFGNPALGDDTGDRVLAAATDETLCFRVSLPFAAPNTLQGQSSNATFTFAAEQTANNP